MTLTTTLYCLCVIGLLVAAISCHQVHHQDQPQAYQQVVNHQQQYQPQNMPQQQQQMPHQQMPQQQMPQQQMPPQHFQQPIHPNEHTGSDHNMGGHINKDHVLEHLDGIITKPKEQMTVDEQNFYYFKLHDYDNNNMLDGLELVSAFAHSEDHKESHDNSEHSNKSDTNGAAPSAAKSPHARASDDELMKLIDDLMKDEDKNVDGYITYQEFLHAIKG